MRLLPILILGAAALATPALALTVSPAPNRDQAPHLKQERGGANGVDLRDSLAGGGRPAAGSSYSSGTAGYGQTQTFSFGSVTTTVTTGRTDFRPTFVTPGATPGFRDPDLIPRRRD